MTPRRCWRGGTAVTPVRWEGAGHTSHSRGREGARGTSLLGFWGAPRGHCSPKVRVCFLCKKGQKAELVGSEVRRRDHTQIGAGGCELRSKWMSGLSAEQVSAAGNHWVPQGFPSQVCRSLGISPGGGDAAFGGEYRKGRGVKHMHFLTPLMKERNVISQDSFCLFICGFQHTSFCNYGGKQQMKFTACLLLG